jgi:hypothetical protein
MKGGGKLHGKQVEEARQTVEEAEQKGRKEVSLEIFGLTSFFLTKSAAGRRPRPLFSGGVST